MTRAQRSFSMTRSQPCGQAGRRLLGSGGAPTPMLALALALAVGCALAAAGCTLMDEPLWSGTRLSSGVGPYRELGGVEVCVSDHRLGTPESSLAGFCVPRAAPARAPCYRDDDCAGRESCVCGFCTIKYCTRNDECGEGRSCDFTLSRCVKRCETDCDCDGPNARCDIGMCQQLCIVNSECQSGEICSLSRARCISVPCSGDGDCFPDEECVIQREPRQVTEPTVLIDPHTGGLVAFFDMIHSGPYERPRHMIFRAVTSDGAHWSVDPAAPVLEPDIPDDYRAPTVVATATGFVLFLESGAGAGILRAESADGRSWTFAPDTPVLAPSAPWEDGRVAAPAAVVGPDGRLRLYYEFGQGDGIAVVTADDGLGLQIPVAPDRRTVVLTPGDVTHELLWRNVTRVRSPVARVVEDGLGIPRFELLFSARGFESPEASSFGTVEQIPSNYSIGYAASADGETFEVYPFNPVFDRVVPNTFVNHSSELAPALVVYDGRTLLFFAGADRDLGAWENLRLAVNPPPLPE